MQLRERQAGRRQRVKGKPGQKEGELGKKTPQEGKPVSRSPTVLQMGDPQARWEGASVN